MTSAPQADDGECGAIPANHLTLEAEAGGGRLMGEGWHFVDLTQFLAGSSIASHHVMALDVAARGSFSVQLRVEDGSLGAIVYPANGIKAFPQERLGMFAGRRVLQLDNFRKPTGFVRPGFVKMNLWRQDKGQAACARAFVHAIQKHGPSPRSQVELMGVGAHHNRVC